MKRINEDGIKHIAEGKCPFCESDEVETEDYAFDGIKAWRDCWCTDCDAMWRVHYRLTTALEHQ